MDLLAKAWFITSKPEKPHECPLTEEEELTDSIDNTSIEMNKLDLHSNMVKY